GTDDVPGWVECPDNALNASGNRLANAEVDGPNGPTTVRDMIDRAGATHGCHTCGTKNPNGPDADSSEGHFVPDHIPPATLHTPRRGGNGIDVPSGGVRLYPQCRRCSSSQGGHLGATSRGTTHQERMDRGQREIDQNLGL
ncbi:MAG: hypothetical protein KC766_33225, partial [Myxococcales bacterium]|nr:hypothetical protein [Myxococcales bacterium]